MKIRKLAVCAIAVLAILLAGCGKEKEAEPPVETAMTEAVYAETQETETMQGTEEDYYAVATTLPADVAEEFALGIREDILRSDWETLAKKVTYPITIGESVIPDEEAFLALNIDERLDPEFVKAVNEESCRQMFCNWQGISMGNAGQIWLGEGPDGLKVIAFNSMLRPDSAADVAAKFAEAYFAGDTEGLKACLSGSFVGNFELYSGDGSAVVVNAIKGLSDVDADPCTASVEFKESADSDHYLYLSIELVRESDGWKVLSYGLEG